MNRLLLMRYLRSKGLQHKDIAELMDLKGHQNVSYHFRKMRSAFIDKVESSDPHEGGVVSLLVGYVSDPPSPSQTEADHSCPHYCQLAAYVQLEDLPKHHKIAVLLSLLAEVELE